MLKLKLTYPSKEEELVILDRMAAVEPDLQVQAVLGPEDLTGFRQAIDAVRFDERLKRYVVDLVQATRRPAEYGLKSLASYIQYRRQPAWHHLSEPCGRAHAFLVGRDYVVTDDIKQLGPDVLRHRIGLTYEAEAEEITAENILQQVFDTLKVP